MTAIATETRARCLPFDHADHLAVARFLTEEAHALDDRDFKRWIEMMDPEVQYRVPVTTTVPARGGAGREAPSDYFVDDLFSLKMRVKRFGSAFAWAEDPPSRTRHMVTNVAVYPTAMAGEVGARSALLVFRSRGDLYPSDFVCGERHDIYRRDPAGEFRLLKRVVRLDEAVLRTQNLSFLL
jgi:3-phenylpropionate/cinnamic acid dioxygenase small subunit